MNTAVRNFRYAARQLRNSPGFALTAILTLTIGIGGTVAVFSVVNAVLLQPLPFRQSDQLVSLHERSDQDPHELRVTAPDMLIFQRESHAFAGVAGFISSAYELTGAGEPFEARGERVSASLFEVLGTETQLGRTFSQQEEDRAAPVAVISYALWKDRFHEDKSVLGRNIDSGSPALRHHRGHASRFFFSARRWSPEWTGLVGPAELNAGGKTK